MKNLILCGILLTLVVLAPFGAGLFAAERSQPVDFFVLVDKSLSTEESSYFPPMIAWAEGQLTGEMLVEGDWLSLFQFYGEFENVLTTTISGDADRLKVREALASIRPDGRFSDIGQALDAIRNELSGRAGSGRYKVMLLLTDLRQEAPWNSRYPGVIDPFESPYLEYSRVIDHGGWYEITLDMDVRDAAAELAERLYREISARGSSPRAVIP